MLTDLPLFAWQPPCQLIPFPMTGRVGKIRDVAAKMLDKSTQRHAESYRDQVTAGLTRQMQNIGQSQCQIDAQLTAFWRAVQAEMIRINFQGHGTGGAA